jgi:hypothetical protein
VADSLDTKDERRYNFSLNKNGIFFPAFLSHALGKDDVIAVLLG